MCPLHTLGAMLAHEDPLRVNVVDPAAPALQTPEYVQRLTCTPVLIQSLSCCSLCTLLRVQSLYYVSQPYLGRFMTS